MLRARRAPPLFRDHEVANRATPGVLNLPPPLGSLPGMPSRLPRPRTLTALPVLALSTALSIAHATALPTTSAAAAVADTPTTVSDLVLTAPPALRGPQAGVLRVSMRLTDPDGVPPGPRRARSLADERQSPLGGTVECPCALLTRSAAAGDPDAVGAALVALTRASGSPRDGMWDGALPVTAAQAGTWVIDDVLAGPAPVDASGLRGVSAQVLGSEWPRLELRALSTVPVSRGRSVTVGGTVRLAGSGRPAADLRLAVWPSATYDSAPTQPVRFVRTDARGRFRWSQRMRGDGGAYVLTVSRYLGTQLVQQEQLRTSWVRSSVSAAPSARSLRTGARVVVSGVVVGPSGANVALQRKVGTRWASVTAAAVVRGRYRLADRPARGSTTYRVLLPRTGEWRSSVSPGFTVVAR